MVPENRPMPPEPDPGDTADTTDDADTEDTKEVRLEQVLAAVPRNPSTPVNLKAIAHKYNVSYDTLRRRHLGETKPKKVSHVNLQKLTQPWSRKLLIGRFSSVSEDNLLTRTR